MVKKDTWRGGAILVDFIVVCWGHRHIFQPILWRQPQKTMLKDFDYV